MRKVAAVFFAFALLCTGAQAAEWGSIAFSPDTGATGYSYNYASRSLAQSWAMSYCGESADDCRIVVNFQSACGAIARGNNGGWGSDWGYTRTEAENNAIAACRSHDRGCRVLRWVCSK